MGSRKSGKEEKVSAITVREKHKLLEILLRRWINDCDSLDVLESCWQEASADSLRRQTLQDQAEHLVEKVSLKQILRALEGNAEDSNAVWVLQKMRNPGGPETFLSRALNKLAGGLSHDLELELKEDDRKVREEDDRKACEAKADKRKAEADRREVEADARGEGYGMD